MTFNLDYVYTGHLPTSSSPYLIATFNDGANCLGGPCGANTVQLILTSSLETSGEFVTEWDFNSTVTSGLTFTQNVGLSSGTFGAPTITVGPDIEQAGGDGRYDVTFDFLSGPPSARFDASDVVVFTITGAGLDVSDFNLLSTPAGGAGPFFTAAHIQGIPGGCSGWVSDGNGLSGAASGVTACGPTTVPDGGATLGLLGLGMLGLGYVRSRSKH
jgi:hypothetical protein